jgi:hypothetical protein
MDAVLLDTCVLLKSYLCDTLLSIAEEGVYRPSTGRALPAHGSDQPARPWLHHLLKPVAQDVEVRLEGVVAERFGLGEQDLHGQQPCRCGDVGHGVSPCCLAGRGPCDARATEELGCHRLVQPL